MMKIEEAGAPLAMALAGALAVPFHASGLQQQTDPAHIVGVVIEETSGEPLANTRVVLDDGRETWTDSAGLFHFERPEPGTRRIAAVTRGCRAAAGSFRVEPGKDALLRLVLDTSSPVVRATDSERTGAAMKVISAERLAEFGDASLYEAVKRETPRVVDGGRRASFPGGAQPMLILDGTRVVHRVFDVLRSIESKSVARVEIVRGNSAAVQHGNAASNGLIRVFTQGVAEPLEANRSAERCTIDWADV